MLARLFRARPMGVAACGLVALEALLAALGIRLPAVAVGALVLAPGMALAPLLPASARRSWTATAAAVPGLGVAASSVALVSSASAGLPLTGTAIRLVLGALVLLGLALSREAEPRLNRRAGLAFAGLLAVVGVGVLLQNRVIGGALIPGNDWGKYLLYADEIRRQHSLLIHNPYWMLGFPRFWEDPGTPALYGSYLAMTAQPASQLVHGIWLFAVTGIFSTYSFVRSMWSVGPALLAALFWAVIPANQDILGWHGLANTAAIALMPLMLLYVSELVVRGLDVRACAGAALMLVGLAAVHKLGFLVSLLIAGLAGAVALVGPRRRSVVRGVLTTAGFGLVLVPGVAYDLIDRGRAFHGTPDYSVYQGAKVDFGLTAGDLTWPFTIAGLLAVALGLAWSRRDARFVTLLAACVGALAVGYAWVAHFGGHYFRMVYFLPLALAPLVAIALFRVLRARTAAAFGLALALVVGVLAWGQAKNVREFYSFVNPASLGALDRLSQSLRPREVVVTDTCWSFLSTWLLHTRTLAALEPEEVLPAAELPRARKGRLVLAGAPAGRDYARRRGIRFALVDPTCPTLSGHPARSTAAGRPVFVSKRLVILRLSTGPRARSVRAAAAQHHRQRVSD